MPTTDMTRYRAQARLIKALAHPTRLMIVEELGRRSRCVCELTELAGADMSTVSKHLAVLRAAGVVRDERRGLEVHYQLRTPCLLNIFACLLSANRTVAREAVAAAR